MITLTIKINQIFWEAFETPCGEPEKTEVRLAFEQAAIEIIENAGFYGEIERGVGKNPTPERYLAPESEPECDECCEGIEAFKESWPLVEKYGEIIYEQAYEAGCKAAQAMSDKFVEESESANEK